MFLAIPAPFVCTHFSRCCTLPRASSHRKESTTVLLQQSVISYTGCQRNSGLTTSCVLFFTSAYTIWRVTCVFQCHRYRIAPVSCQMLTATHGIGAEGQKHLALAFFAVLGPSIWNTLPATVRDPLSINEQFCSKLKSVMFNTAYMTLNRCAYVTTVCIISLELLSNLALLACKWKNCPHPYRTVMFNGLNTIDRRRIHPWA